MTDFDTLEQPHRARQIEDDASREPNSALKKSLAVLEMLVSETQPLSGSNIASRLGLSRQAVSRLLRQLEDLALIRRLPDNLFTVGPRTNKLAIDIIHATHISADVRAILQNVVTLVGETCNIGMLDGYELVYIDRVECNWPLRVQLRPGSRVEAYCTAIGKLLLAHLPSRRRERLLSVMPLERRTANTITDRGALSKHLKEIRDQGYSINDQEDSMGLIAIAVPIRNPSGKVIAGLAVHGPEMRMSLEKAKGYLGDLRAAADQLGEALDFSSSGI